MNYTSPRKEESQDKVMILVHCILNQATRARWEGGGTRKVKGSVNEVVDLLLKNRVGIIQLECPEQALYGNPRPPKSKNEYNIQEFKEKCSEIATRTLHTLGNGRNPMLIAVLGFEGSPSCGVERTTVTMDGAHVSSPGEGLLIEALREEIEKKKICVTFIGVGLKTDEMRKAVEKINSLL